MCYVAMFPLGSVVCCVDAWAFAVAGTERVVLSGLLYIFVLLHQAALMGALCVWDAS